MVKQNTFGPQSQTEQAIFAAEAFRVDLQGMLQQKMNEQSVSYADLAQRLRVSEASIDKLFSSDCDVTIKFLVKVFHALGCDIELTCHERK